MITATAETPTKLLDPNFFRSFTTPTIETYNRAAMSNLTPSSDISSGTSSNTPNNLPSSSVVNVRGGAHYDIIVIGAGGVGSATAYHCARDGKSVLLLEQFTIGHTRGS